MIKNNDVKKVIGYNGTYLHSFQTSKLIHTDCHRKKPEQMIMENQSALSPNPSLH